ncbi:MAG TPA: sugar-binding transcriptional regulator [Solirubrobacteraceae bacterium]|nr:sugar-binding transcriptional regulator [Solirubrobacteraceae bacterium]
MATPRPLRSGLARVRGEEQLRLMTKIARLYHEHGVNQPEIARRLHVSQARVSRLLKQAEVEGIVRTTVVVPEGVQTALEEALEARYGLREAVVVECLDESESGIIHDLGVATANYLETSLTGGDVVGISSWSATLLAAVDAMRPLPRAGAERAIQLFGGVGSPGAEAHAARLTQRFADLTGAQPTFLLTPGIAASPSAREALMQDRFVREALEQLGDVTLALVGIGALEPSTLLQSSGNIFSEPELAALGERGAVGDICLRFFGADGRRVDSEVDRRVIGVSLEQLRSTDRSVGIAGGARKYEAIRGAIRGRWINVLITDRTTAERLLAEPDPAAA